MPPRGVDAPTFTQILQFATLLKSARTPENRKA